MNDTRKKEFLIADTPGLSDKYSNQRIQKTN